MGKKRSGFTLLELLIVLVVAAVLSTLALSPRRGEAEVAAASRELASLLFTAQNRAVLHQRDVMVRFDTADRRVTVTEEDDEGSEQSVDVWTPSDGIRFGRGPASPLSMGEAAATFRAGSTDTPELVFHRSGSASEWGGLYLSTSRASRGFPDEVRALEVDRGTGRVTLWRHDVRGWSRQ
jgi:prepilin-type N-terminal cleavage/methylation domain-containing protein